MDNTPTTNHQTDGHPPELLEFAFMKHWPNTLSDLAALAEEENWGTGSEEAPLPVLRNYLFYTYKRLVTENKVVVNSNQTSAVFNTGLLSQFAEQIFALFGLNSMSDARQRWHFDHWAVESDRELMTAFPDPPDMVDIASSLEDMVFDWRREIRLNYAHIINENRYRLPDFASSAQAKSSLDSAVQRAVLRARRNYRIVVPQWYAAQNKMGLLMPLDFGSGQAESALVLEPMSDKAYRGSTVYTIDQAYSFARLIAKPENEWLKPL